MGNVTSNNNLLNFEDIQHIIRGNVGYLLINTLSLTEQSCLIRNTIQAAHEEQMVISA